MKLTSTRLLAVLLGGTVLLLPQAAQAQKPKPDVENAKYGPHERNVLDLWKAKSDTPTPLVVFIHGGGFRGGDKANLAPGLLAGCRNAGQPRGHALERCTANPTLDQLGDTFGQARGVSKPPRAPGPDLDRAAS